MSQPPAPTPRPPLVQFEFILPLVLGGLGPLSEGGRRPVHGCRRGVPSDRTALATAAAAGLTLGFLEISLLTVFGCRYFCFAPL